MNTIKLWSFQVWKKEILRKHMVVGEVQRGDNFAALYKIKWLQKSTSLISLVFLFYFNGTRFHPTPKLVSFTFASGALESMPCALSNLKYHVCQIHACVC